MNLNWKLIFQLSLFGLIMSVATVFWVPMNIEPFCWLVIFTLCAYIIVKNTSGKYFLHGFMVSIINSVWITAAHVIFYDAYMATHPEMASMNEGQSNPQLMMIFMGPFFGAAFGLILGAFSFAAGKIIKK